MSILSKNKLKEQTTIRCVLCGILTAIFILLLGSGIASVLIYNGKLKETSVGLAAPVLVFLSVLGGGCISAKLRKRKAAVISAITAGVIILILICINIILFDAELGGVLPRFLAAFLGWIMASIIGVGKKKKR